MRFRNARVHSIHNGFIDTGIQRLHLLSFGNKSASQFFHKSVNIFMCFWCQGKPLSSLVAPLKLHKYSKGTFTCCLWSTQSVFRIFKVLNYLLLSLIRCCFTSDTLWNTLVMSRMSMEIDCVLDRKPSNSFLVFFSPWLNSSLLKGRAELCSVRKKILQSCAMSGTLLCSDKGL